MAGDVAQAVATTAECVGFWQCSGELVSSAVFRNLSFLLGVAVAVVSVLSAKATARKKQAADLLLSSRSDTELVEGLRKLAKLHENDTVNMRSFARKNQADSDEAQTLRYVLNHWEYVSVGVQAGIYDEQMLREASFGTVRRLHETTKPFIAAIREEYGRPTIYQEFEWLAERWEAAGLKGKKKKHR